MNYSFPDYLNYCAQELDVRADGEIIWFNKQPIPAVIIKKLFLNSSNYLNDYMNHLFSAMVVAFMDIDEETKHFEKLPLKKYSESYKAELSSGYDKAVSQNSFVDFTQKIARASGNNYGEFDRSKFLSALAHNGKKYERLYYPDSIKKLISETFSSVLTKLKRNNGDMMGNILADDLNIYRGGYSDAFAALFKKFLDFKFDIFAGTNHNETLHGQTSSLEVENFGEIEYSENIQGNLWQPKMVNGGLINTVIDRNHPINDLTENQLNYLLLALSDVEQKTVEPDDKRAIEDFRYRVSMTLRKIIEIDKNTSS